MSRISELLFHRNSQRDEQRRKRVAKLLNRRKPYLLEALEPRMLLSAEAAIGGLPASLDNGLSAVGTELGQLIAQGRTALQQLRSGHCRNEGTRRERLSGQSDTERSTDGAERCFGDARPGHE